MHYPISSLIEHKQKLYILNITRRIQTLYIFTVCTIAFTSCRVAKVTSKDWGSPANTLIAGCQTTTIPNSVTEIGDYIINERSSMKESDQGLMTVSIKADKETKMGIIAEIKQELRRAYALKISYAATQRTSY